MNSEISRTDESKKIKVISSRSNTAKTIMSYASITIGIVGFCLFFSPIPEIICGVGGLILSKLSKDKNASWFTDAVRKYGNYAAWINIIWVCLEFGLSFVGIDVFNTGNSSSMDFID